MNPAPRPDAEARDAPLQRRLPGRPRRVVAPRYPPWWPSVIVDRTVREKDVVLATGETLPVPKKNNCMVELFVNGEALFSVLDFTDLLEYSTNLQKARAAGEDTDGDVDACQEANAYIETDGMRAQRDLFNGAAFVLPGKRPVSASVPPVDRPRYASEPNSLRLKISVDKRTRELQQQMQGLRDWPCGGTGGRAPRRSGGEWSAKPA